MPDVRVTAQQRTDVAMRANGRCEYCRTSSHFSTSPYAVEHIIPRAKGGSTTLDNLAFSCAGCNGYKYLRTEWEDPLTRNIVSLFHPRQQKWSLHFSWSKDSLRLIGLTSIGRATIVALKLNRPELINLRRALYAINEHPPQIN